MAKSKKRTKAIADKRSRKMSTMNRPGAKSRYAKKKVYCVKHGCFGFEVPDPKPWK